MNYSDLVPAFDKYLFEANLNFELFFKTIESFLNNPVDTIHAQKYLTNFNKKNIPNSCLPEFIRALNNFGKKDSVLQNPDISKCFQYFKYDSVLFLYLIVEQDKDGMAFFNKIRKNVNFEDYINLHNQLLIENRVTALPLFYENINNHKYNNCELLRSYFRNSFVHYDFTHQMIQKYQLDINAVGTLSDTKTKTNFVHSVFYKDESSGHDFFNQFIIDYKTEINFDIGASPGNHNPLMIIEKNKLLTEYERLDRFSHILNHCYLSEKHISQIAQYLLKADIIVAHYDHHVFENLFKHSTFNSSSFDRESILKQILYLDTHFPIIQLRRENSNTVNPITILLDKFYNFTENNLITQVSPFFTWIKHNSSHYSDSLVYIANKYKEDIESSSLKDIHSIPTACLDMLISMNFNLPKKKNFFQKMWEGTKSKPSLERKITIDNHVDVFPPVKPIEALNFDLHLFKLVKDNDIQKYIESIQLNVEQYTVVFNNNLVYENEHYMKNILPKFLNKTIENYLHFSTMEEEDAKNNVLIQLKLLNKKTFEVLNNGLAEEKSLILKNDRVNKRIINSY